MKKSILIVDDSELVHKMYGEKLERGGFTVLHAYDGIQAINSTFSNMPDLVLLDIQMPKINGYQVCRLLKDHPITKSVRIIIVTGHSGSGIVADPRKWSFQTGADGYFDKGNGDMLIEFIKPFLEQFPDAVRKTAGNPALTESEIMTALSELLDRQLYLDITRLKELDQRKSDFVSNVAHEFKSPLNVIIGYIQVVMDEAMGSINIQQKDALEKASKTAWRLNRLVTDLLDLGKMEAGKMSLKKEVVQVQGLIDEVVDAYGLAAKEKKLSIKKQTGPLTILGDRDRLLQVFINLMSNSVKFTPENGAISVNCFEDGASVRFEISDTGPGMSKENLEKIFDKFERITTSRVEGTGLGLSIAKDMVALHGGKIWAESEEGKGSRFTVILPR